MRVWSASLFVGSLWASSAVAAPLVYTGHTVTSEKTAFADETLPENQDFILNGVIITRGDAQGIYNIAQEGTYEFLSSPAGTEWAFPANNPEVTLSAAECLDGCPEFTFEVWVAALNNNPPGTVGQDAVLHLIDQDIYLDIRFTSWANGRESPGGAFGYERSAITPSADFDRDGDVDGRDFLTWQRNFGQSDALQSQGDADFDGTVTGDDLEVWQNSYGSSPIAILSVPEPTSALLTGILGLALTRRLL